MPKLFQDGNWYFEVSPRAFSENEFESLLSSNVDCISSNYLCVPFKKTTYDDTGTSARADLALIRNDYSDWRVVEVEMETHSLEHHVIPQVITLRDGIYDGSHAQYIASKNADLSIERLKSMMKGDQPRVLVIVNKPNNKWDRTLRAYGVDMMTFEIYRSKRNRHIFRIDGQFRRLSNVEITRIEPDRVLPKFFRINSPGALEFSDGEQIDVLVDNQMTRWERVDISNISYLTPLGRMPLTKPSKHFLVRNDQNQYELLSSECN